VCVHSIPDIMMQRQFVLASKLGIFADPNKKDGG